MGLKTQKNDAGINKFLAGIADEQKRTNCLDVLKLMKEITGEPAVMWRKAIVGLGSFRYRGKTSGGNWFHVGFSPRKQNLVFTCTVNWRTKQPSWRNRESTRSANPASTSRS